MDTNHQPHVVITSASAQLAVVKAASVRSPSHPDERTSTIFKLKKMKIINLVNII